MSMAWEGFKVAKQHVGAPKLQLVQIGNARVPTINATTSVSYTPRQAITEMHSGATYDHDRWYPPPLVRGTIEHTGVYRCYGTYQCSHAADELMEIQSSKQVRTRFLFYQHSDCPPVGWSLNQPGDCGKWLWAMGRVTAVSNPFSVQEFFGATTTEIGIQAYLETPLLEASWSKYRYGGPLAVLQHPDMYSGTMEATIAEPVDQWWTPCGPPEQFEPKRFWMREKYPLANTAPFLFSYTTWEPSAMYTFLDGTVKSIYIDGNALPRCRWIVTFGGLANCIITVENKTGSRDYRFNNLVGTIPYEQYRDSWTSGGYDLIGGTTFQATGSNAFTPLLVPGDNLVTVAGHPARLGVHYAWIN